ncbi:MAG: hypothetical protein R3F34_02270 [Planctomycetota bacterium]
MRTAVGVLVAAVLLVLAATFDGGSSGDTIDTRAVHGSDQREAPELAREAGVEVERRALEWEGATAHATIDLVAVARIVRDGEPVGGATVVLHSAASGEVRTLTSDDDGLVHVPSEVLGEAPFDVLAGIPGACNEDLVVVRTDGTNVVDVPLGDVSFGLLRLVRSDGSPRPARTEARGTDPSNFDPSPPSSRLPYLVRQRFLRGTWSASDRRLLALAGLPESLDLSSALPYVFCFPGASGNTVKVRGTVVDCDTSPLEVEFEALPLRDGVADVSYELEVVPEPMGALSLAIVDQARPGVLRECGPGIISLGGRVSAGFGHRWSVELDHDAVADGMRQRIPLPEGRWAVTLSFPNWSYRSKPQSFVVAPGVDTELDLVAPEFGRVRFHLDREIGPTETVDVFWSTLSRDARDWGLLTVSAEEDTFPLEAGRCIFIADPNSGVITTSGTAPEGVDPLLASVFDPRDAASDLWAAEQERLGRPTGRSVPGITPDLLDGLGVDVEAGRTVDVYLVRRGP